MAGRGVDIKLDDGVRELGGLYVLGTERHEARRIDNQLRGRSGRQGDPGETRFYLSGQDDLVRLFAGDRIYNIMERFKLPDDQPMEAKILSNQIENAQKKVEEQNFVARKNVLKYDDVMNVQRLVIYEQRRARARGRRTSPSEIKELWIDEVIDGRRRTSTPTEQTARSWDLDALVERDGRALRHRRSPPTSCARTSARRARRSSRSSSTTRSEAYKAKRGGARGVQELMRELERFVVLQVVDTRWREHLENMDYLREGIHLRGDGPEGPARRVPERGPRDVRGARPRDPRGGRLHCSSTPSSSARGAPGDGAAAARPLAERQRRRVAQLRARVARRRRRDRRRRRRRRRPATALRAAAVRRAAAPVVKSEHDEHRPQRPVLVRLGQEVQEVPRRLAAVRRLGIDRRMADQDVIARSEQLEEIGAQLAWVRDYL